MDWIYEEDMIYSLDEDGEILAKVSFPLIGENLVDIDSTYVNPKARGMGYASLALEQVADHLTNKGYKAICSCPYALKWFKKNREELMA